MLIPGSTENWNIIGNGIEDNGTCLVLSMYLLPSVF